VTVLDQEAEGAVRRDEIPQLWHGVDGKRPSRQCLTTELEQSSEVPKVGMREHDAIECSLASCRRAQGCELRGEVGRRVE
jgi:hypothetical protein